MNEHRKLRMSVPFNEGKSNPCLKSVIYEKATSSVNLNKSDKQAHLKSDRKTDHCQVYILMSTPTHRQRQLQKAELRPWLRQ